MSIMKRLCIYYCANLGNNQDINYIKECLQIYLNIHYNIKLEKFEKYKEDLCCDIDDLDILKRGLVTFNNMFTNLKLKDNLETWFVYISNGNIKDISENIFLMLINKNPGEKKAFYAINKTKLDINKDYNKKKKIENLQILKNTIGELFSNNKYVNYNTL